MFGPSFWVLRESSPKAGRRIQTFRHFPNFPEGRGISCWLQNRSVNPVLQRDLEFPNPGPAKLPQEYLELSTACSNSHDLKPPTPENTKPRSDTAVFKPRFSFVCSTWNVEPQNQNVVNRCRNPWFGHRDKTLSGRNTCSLYLSRSVWTQQGKTNEYLSSL